MQKHCKHCGTPFEARSDSEEFCCSGCEYVYRIIHDAGLEDYYDFKDKTTQPVGNAVFHQRSYQWLSDLQTQREAQSPHGDPSLVLALEGISCIGCVWLIEKVFLDMPGSRRIDINAQNGQIQVEWIPEKMNLEAFAKGIQKFGYQLAPAKTKNREESSKLISKIGLCAAFAMNGMLFTLPRYLGMPEDFQFARLFELLVILFATLSLLTGGSYFIYRAYQALRHRVMHIDLPIALGILGAYAGSMYGWQHGDVHFLYFDFVSIFIFLMLTGRWLQEKAIEKNRNQLSAQSIFPNELKDSEGNPLDIDDLESGMRYELNSGDTVPVSSVLLSGQANFSLQWINGESDIVSSPLKARIASGAIYLGKDTITLQAEENWEASLLQRLLKKSEQHFRNRKLESILRIYLLSILLISFLAPMVWLYAGSPLNAALQVALSILVVSCPCALGVALPLVDELSISQLRRQGVFVRETSLFNRLRRLKHIIFDKTGTLTMEVPRMLNPEALESLTQTQRSILLSLVESTRHPVSRSIREHLLRRYPNTMSVSLNSIDEIAGKGIEGQHEDRRYRLGQPAWAIPEEISTHDCVFGYAQVCLGEFDFQDEIRSQARTEIDWLSRKHQVYILSGDRKGKVNAMAQHLGLPSDHAHGEYSPDEKATWVTNLDQNDSLYIGDGINDSIAFDKAYCRGTPVVDKSILESKSDFYFTGKNLSAIRLILQISRKRQWAHRLIISFSISYNLIAIYFCFLGKMSPLLAAILMPISSIATLILTIQTMKSTINQT